MGNAMSAAYRFAKRYDCMDMPEAVDPNVPHHADRAAGSTNGDSYDVSGTSSRDMVATLYENKSSIRDFYGKRFTRSYALGKKVGENIRSEVFEATIRGSPTGSQLYMVKRTAREGLTKKDEKRLCEEVRILRMLQHSNVVGVYQFFKDDPKYYYVVMEHMAGGELFDRIVQKTYYNEEDARDICRGLLESVRYCHELGIVHRDLKPENLLVTSKADDASIKLADFGFACSVLNGNVTEKGGSPGYVAPEVLRGLPYGTSVDMWSIGVIIYTLLGGYPPFHDENQTRLFRRIKAGSFRFHDEYWSDISAEAKDLIQRLLLVDANKRLTATHAVDHPWLLRTGQELAQHDLRRNLEQLRIFNAIRKLRAAVRSRLPASVDLQAH